LDFTLAAAKLKAKYPISFADAFAAALTIKGKATLITSDDEFEALIREANFKVRYL
jgi:predicted nucleic acid-binding protein